MKLNFLDRLPERFYDPDAIYGIMFDNGCDASEDHGTFRIAAFLWVIDGIFFRKRARLTRFYLWRWQMFNAGLVEGTGLLIYLTMVPFFLNLLLPMGVSVAWWITTCFVAPCSFLAKYILYDRWLFKKHDLSFLEEEEEISNTELHQYSKKQTARILRNLRKLGFVGDKTIKSILAEIEEEEDK